MTNLSKRGPHTMTKWNLGFTWGFIGWAHEPSDRLWGHTETTKSGVVLRTRHLFTIHFVESVPKNGRYWQMYLGPLYISWVFRWIR
jgi:hypothetical protein